MSNKPSTTQLGQTVPWVLMADIQDRQRLRHENAVDAQCWHKTPPVVGLEVLLLGQSAPDQLSVKLAGYSTRALEL
jgi:hypothetical protein